MQMSQAKLEITKTKHQKQVWNTNDSNEEKFVSDAFENKIVGLMIKGDSFLNFPQSEIQYSLVTM